jgi:hypothetical protein
MKHIKPYKIFESASPNFPTTKEEVIEVCEKYKIEKYSINDDLSIDVDGDVYLDSQSLEYLPLKFNYVSGNFNCFVNKLKTLEGSPQTVSRHFDCSDNDLETLKGSPQTVGGYFDCANNKLVSLKGCPQTVGGHFNCYENELKDLEYIPEVSGNVYIKKNPVYLLLYTFIKNADSFMIEDFNDYEIVRNRDTVMLDRLKTFIEGFDLEMPNLEEIKKHYKIIE